MLISDLVRTAFLPFDQRVWILIDLVVRARKEIGDVRLRKLNDGGAQRFKRGPDLNK